MCIFYIRINTRRRESKINFGDGAPPRFLQFSQTSVHGYLLRCRIEMQWPIEKIMYAMWWVYDKYFHAHSWMRILTEKSYTRTNRKYRNFRPIIDFLPTIETTRVCVYVHSFWIPVSNGNWLVKWWFDESAILSPSIRQSWVSVQSPRTTS